MIYTTENFKELFNLVNQGEEPLISKWFEKHIKNDLELENTLVSDILNSAYFFSFFNNNYSNSEYDSQKLKRELYILKNLTSVNQLKLFTASCIHNTNFEHFKYINNNKINRELLTTNPTASYVVTKLLSNENFTDILKISNKYNIDFLNNKQHEVIFNYTDNYSNGALYLLLEEKIFCPKQNIVFQYTESKKNFLIDNNIELPSVNEAIKLKEAILLSLSKNAWSDREIFRDQIDKSFSLYIKQKTYLDLESNLLTSVSSKKKLKV